MESKSEVVHAVDMASVAVHQNGTVTCNLAHPIMLPPGVKMHVVNDSPFVDSSKRGDEIRPEFEAAARMGGAYVLPLPKGYGKTTSIITLANRMLRRGLKVVILCDNKETLKAYRQNITSCACLAIRSHKFRSYRSSVRVAFFWDADSPNGVDLRNSFQEHIRKFSPYRPVLSILTMTSSESVMSPETTHPENVSPKTENCTTSSGSGSGGTTPPVATGASDPDDFEAGLKPVTWERCVAAAELLRDLFSPAFKDSDDGCPGNVAFGMNAMLFKAALDSVDADLLTHASVEVVDESGEVQYPAPSRSVVRVSRRINWRTPWADKETGKLVDPKQCVIAPCVVGEPRTNRVVGA